PPPTPPPTPPPAQPALVRLPGLLSIRPPRCSRTASRPGRSWWSSRSRYTCAGRTSPCPPDRRACCETCHPGCCRRRPAFARRAGRGVLRGRGVERDRLGGRVRALVRGPGRAG